jgi:hypothetical protein
VARQLFDWSAAVEPSPGDALSVLRVPLSLVDTNLLLRWPGSVEGDVKFVLEVDMGDDAFGGNAAAELGRILRYWGGNMQHFPLLPGDGSAIYDSAYRQVGHWRIVDSEESAGDG